MSVASAAVMGPWALVILLVLMLGLLRVEVELGTAGEPAAPPTDVVPLRDDTA